MIKIFVYSFLNFVLACNAQKTKAEFCNNLNCVNITKQAACGLREEGEGFRLRVFENECELLKYGCDVEDNQAFGIINFEYCKQTFFNDTKITSSLVQNLFAKSPERPCVEYDCSYPGDAGVVCGIRQDGAGFRVRLFENKCQLIMFNCKSDTNFTITDLYLCNGIDLVKDTETISRRFDVKNKVFKPMFVVDASIFNFNNINETIDNFFAATHLLNLPLVEVQKNMSDSGRRMMVKIFGPQVVFKPWITIPKNISEDYYHKPTLSSCFHKCPTKCPPTYAPVCGVPGIVAREPSLMFQNHCFMDVAQCKMHWEDKSDTAESSSYIESSFMFCLGDEMSAMFRFLPLVRTLQHMGRLKKKGMFRYHVRSLRFHNNVMMRSPNLMG